MKLDLLERRCSNLIIILLAVAALLVMLSACAGGLHDLPVFRNVPEILTLDMLVKEYSEDPAAASEKYGGRTYLFPGVVVDYVLSPTLTPADYQLGGKPHFTSGQVTLLARYLYDLDTIAPGFTVDVQGEVQGWVQSEFVITNCIFSIAKGGDMPPPGAY